jgi:hypothetical protein
MCDHSKCASAGGQEYLSAFNYICATNADATRGDGLTVRAAAGSARAEPKRITALDAMALEMSKKK